MAAMMPPAHQLFFDDLRHVHLQAAGKLTHRDLVGNGYLQLRLTSLFPAGCAAGARPLSRAFSGTAAGGGCCGRGTFVCCPRAWACGGSPHFSWKPARCIFVELIQIHVRDAGIHRDGDDLPRFSGAGLFSFSGLAGRMRSLRLAGPAATTVPSAFFRISFSATLGAGALAGTRRGLPRNFSACNARTHGSARLL